MATQEQMTDAAVDTSSVISDRFRRTEREAGLEATKNRD